MKYKLIATDYDQTLANTPEPPTQRALNAISQFEKKGGIFTIVSGRMTHGIVSNLGSVRPNAPIISYQGGELYDADKGQIVAQWPICNRDAQILVEDLTQRNCEINLYYNGDLYVSKLYAFTPTYCRLNNIECKIVPDLLSFVRNDTRVTPSKILVTLTPDKAAEYEKEYSAKYKGVLERHRSSATFLEFTEINADKGKAVMYLANMYGIDISQVICMGDSINDITMIKAAGLGVAMGNAMEQVKQSADFVAYDCANDGWAKFVE